MTCPIEPTCTDPTHATPMQHLQSEVPVVAENDWRKLIEGIPNATRYICPWCSMWFVDIPPPRVEVMELDDHGVAVRIRGTWEDIERIVHAHLTVSHPDEMARVFEVLRRPAPTDGRFA